MPSLRERLVRAFVTALDGPGKPAGVTVHRERWRPIERDTLPATIPYLADPPLGGTTESVERMDMGADRFVRRLVNVVVQLRVTDNEPDAALDPLYVWVVQTVMTDPGIRALVHDIQERRSSHFDAAELGKPVGGGNIHFEAELHTAEDDPSGDPTYD